INRGLSAVNVISNRGGEIFISIPEFTKRLQKNGDGLIWDVGPEILKEVTGTRSLLESERLEFIYLCAFIDREEILNCHMQEWNGLKDLLLINSQYEVIVVNLVISPWTKFEDIAEFSNRIRNE